jgi:hypothetical protein
MIQNDNTFRPGDIVIGSSDPNKSVYSSTGAKVIDDGVVVYGDSTTLNEYRKAIVTSAARGGGKPVTAQKPVNKKLAKKKTTKMASNNVLDVESYMQSFQEQQQVQIYEKQPITVQFENAFGRIKAHLEDLIEHEQAFMLVFKNEDSVLFEPKVGESLTLHTSLSGMNTVYYPGVTFDWPNSSKKLMILFKVPADQE